MYLLQGNYLPSLQNNSRIHLGLARRTLFVLMQMKEVMFVY